LLHLYGAIMVSSEHMRAEYVQHGLPADRLHLAPCPPAGITADSAPPAPRTLNGRLLLVGRLTTLKGGHYLLHAMRRATRQLGRTLSLTVLGTGPEREVLQRLSRRLGVPVEFVGWCDADRRNAYFRSSDLLAVPSLWSEPYGLVGPEAACAGLPAVGFAVGGIPEWLIPGVTGELASGDPPTPHGLASAIVRGLGDAQHHAVLCRGAWGHSQRIDVDQHLAKLDSVFANLTRAPA
jgi:glycosyltransferase involved in cell wall biosynthesis